MSLECSHEWVHVKTWETFDTSGIEPGSIIPHGVVIHYPMIVHDEWYCKFCRVFDETTRDTKPKEG